MRKFAGQQLFAMEKRIDIVQKFLKSRAVRFTAMLFILLSITSVVLSSFKEFQQYGWLFQSFIHFASLVFLIEYLLRIYSAPALYRGLPAYRSRLKYVFSFYGLVDLVAVIPFVMTYFYWDTEIVHIIILPYVFVVFKLIRYSTAFQLILKVMKSVRSELLTAFTACLIIICFSAILVYFVEKGAQPEVFKNIGDSMWWAVITFTTVGYGDIYPVTPIGRILCAFISFIGIAMLAIPTGIIQTFEKELKLSNPGFDGSPGSAVEQLAALPVKCGILFPELGGGVGDAAAAGGGEGDDGLA